ncbi:hypothetical protein GJ496_002676 [Pomphorhynchus laevis]|nr:hypothetical protein GJ496_002676 [Pomphorhynchus laevis]
MQKEEMNGSNKKSEKQNYHLAMTATGSKPLNDFKIVKNGNGSITRSMDDILHCLVVKLRSSTTSNTYITVPKVRSQPLNISLPVVNIYVRNLSADFKIELEILDSRKTLRTFKFSTFTRQIKCNPTCASIPLHWKANWNLLTINMNEFTQKLYETKFCACSRITVFANCHLRQIFFSRQECDQSRLPSDFWITSDMMSNQDRINLNKSSASSSCSSFIKFSNSNDEPSFDDISERNTKAENENVYCKSRHIGRSSNTGNTNSANVHWDNEVNSPCLLKQYKTKRETNKPSVTYKKPVMDFKNVSFNKLKSILPNRDLPKSIYFKNINENAITRTYQSHTTKFQARIDNKLKDSESLIQKARRQALGLDNYKKILNKM